jgi:DNA polymerase V
MIYKKCGVVLLDLMAETNIVPDFFVPTNAKRQMATQTMDALNRKFGKNTVFSGALGVNPRWPRWKARSDKCSPHYTSNWDELPIAHAGDTKAL